MLKVGLTGGIASGKSTVLRHFAELGIPVISADEVGRQLLAPGSPVIDGIKDLFGDDIVIGDTLDRQALKQRVFSSPPELKRLEALLHPLIYQAMADWAEGQTAAYVILEIPLLIETGQQDFVDRILVVDCDEADQKARAQVRDRLDDATLNNILATQCAREERLRWADDIIRNTGTSADLVKQIKALDETYRKPGPSGSATEDNLRPFDKSVP